MATITVGMVIRSDLQDAAGVSRVAEIARALGFEVSAMGLATLSARISEAEFEKIFRVRSRAVPAEPPSRGDAGAPSGFAVDQPLPVPSALEEWVESISVIPPARRL